MGKRLKSKQAHSRILRRLQKNETGQNLRRHMDPIDHFFNLGSQYYIAARFAAFGRLNPVVGNLFHHSIEMYLKGGLSKTKNLQQLEKFRHKLPAIWKAFKDQTTGAALSQFDATIADLDRYEELRYPNAALAKGMGSTINIMRSNASVTGGISVPQYELCVQDIDELVAAIFSAASRNPKAYFQGLAGCAREFLMKDNTVGGRL